MATSRTTIKRETDLQIMGGWIGEGERVLDLGCGRGLFLEHLIDTKRVYGVGVDSDPEKILGCVKRGVPAYQGDLLSFMQEFRDDAFDWVVCSRTVQELAEPGDVIQEALRVGSRVGIGFVNNGYWSNRLSHLATGGRIRNLVYPQPWERSRPYNPISTTNFEAFCERAHIQITERVCLRGDWRTPVGLWPSWRCGYALYQITRA